MTRRLLLTVGCTVTLLAAGCATGPAPSVGGGASPGRGGGGGYYQNDGPPDDENIDISSIPDAVPTDEPLSKYGNPSSYQALGNTYYVLKSAAGFTQTGRASWYGRQFHGERTSSGEPYNMYKMTAAHKRLPIPCYVRVTNLDNGKHVIVRVNDRGPFHDGRIIDLSYVAARKLDIVAHGSAPVRIETVTPASLRAEADTSPAPGSRPSAPAQAAPTTTSSKTTVAQRAQNAAAAPSAASSTGAHAVRVANRTGSGDSPGLYLQAGAFGDPANARRQRSRLRQAGFNNVSITDPDAATGFYRVRVGPFDNDRGRALTQQILADRGFSTRNVSR